MNMKHLNEKQILVNELHRKTIKKFKRRRTIIKGLDDLWQADLAIMTNQIKNNRGYGLILVVIDCFSKYMWTVPLKSKSGAEVSAAMKKILMQGRVPKNLQTDQGREFYNSTFAQLMNQYKINHYSTFSVIKAAIVERVVRTLKERLFKHFSMTGSFKWVDVISKITDEYNDTKHSTIQTKPKNVTVKNEKLILQTYYNVLKQADLKNKFAVGDLVRISKEKYLFDKGYTPKWTTELFRIVKVCLTNPTTYLLEDLRQNPLRGGFYAQELQKTKQPDVYLVEKILRRKGSKVYIKWLGLDNSHNSWEEKKNIL